MFLTFVNTAPNCGSDEINNFKIYPNSRVEDAKFWLGQGKTELGVALDRLKRIVGKSKEKGYEWFASLKRPKNLILFIGDGLGISTVTAARIFKGQSKHGISGEESSLVWEEFPEVALLKTYTVDYQTPDSAGTATALFSGVKTNFKILGYDSGAIEKSPSSQLKANKVTSVLQWAQESGIKTGFVTNTRLTHATPGALYSHVANRNWECDAYMNKSRGYILSSEDQPDPKQFLDIARQMIERKPGNLTNVIFGGGALAFKAGINKTSGICEREDGRDLFQQWKNEKDQISKNRNFIIRSKDELKNINPVETDYVLGVFSDNHVNYDDQLDSSNPNDHPSLKEMATKAVEILKRNPAGFFLMVEGGRIDHGHHGNNANRALNETLAFEAAMREVMENLKQSNQLDDTLIIVTADHSHVMTISGYPKRGTDIRGLTGDLDPEKIPEPILSYANGAGYFKPSPADDCKRKDLSKVNMFDINHRSPAGRPGYSESHGGEDVGLWATGPMSFLFHKVHEQSYVAHAASLALCIGPHKDHDACKKPKIVNSTSKTKSGGTKRSSFSAVILVFVGIMIFPFNYLIN